MIDVTPEGRKALRELADRATPGPWETKDDQPEVKIVSDFRVEGSSEVANWIATVDDSPDFGDDEDEVSERNHNNAAFIAAAREAVPALLDALEASERQNDHREDYEAIKDNMLQFQSENAALRLTVECQKGSIERYRAVAEQSEAEELAALQSENASLRARVEALEHACGIAAELAQHAQHTLDSNAGVICTGNAAIKDEYPDHCWDFHDGTLAASIKMLRAALSACAGREG